MTALEKYEAALPEARRAHDRDMLRRKAANYERKAMDLYRWTFPPTRKAVFNAVHQPGDPNATRALCKAIYADLILARELPAFYQRRAARASVLRELFACECWTYRNQRRRAMAQAAE